MKEDRAPRTGRLRRPASKAAMGLAVSVALLAFVELALRLVLGPPPPPVNVISGLGGYDGYLQVDERGVVATTCRSGREQGRFMPDQEPRPVVVIGGSSVHGGSGNLPMTEEFPAVLGAMLKRPVTNLGCPSLDSFDLARIVDQLVQWPVAVVVVYTGHNDFGNTFFQKRYDGLAGGLSAHVRALLERSALYAHLRRALFTRVEGASGGTTDWVPWDPGIDAEQKATAGHHLAANLRSMVWKLRRAGIGVVLVTPVSDLSRVPTGRACSDQPCALDLWREGSQIARVDPTRAGVLLRQARDLDPIPIRAPSSVTETCRRVADEEGAVLADIEPLLPHEPGTDIPSSQLFQDHVHFSAYGHRAVGEVLVPFVEQALQREP